MAKVSWSEYKRSVFSKTNGFCYYCGCTITMEAFQVDHVICKNYWKENWRLLPAGFKIDDISNLVPACATCNSSKSDLSVEGFRERLKGRVADLRRTSPQFRMLEAYGLVEIIDIPVTFYYER